MTIITIYNSKYIYPKKKNNKKIRYLYYKLFKMTDVLINLPPSESKSNENTDIKTDIMNQLKKNDIAW